MLRFLNRPGVAEIEAAPSAVPEAPLLGLCEGLAARCSGERRRVGSEAVVMKGGPFSPSGARRHGLRRLLLRAPGPCAAEFWNLAWLRKRLLRAAEPLAAVTVHHLGRPSRELLLTREVPDAVPFDHALREAPSRRRAELLAELGREVGRMHALRFLHADLYPRNVLVTPPCERPGPGFGRSLVWIDAWAGGPTAWRRGNLRRLEDDLGAWYSLAADWMTPADDGQLLTAYVRSRAANGRPVRSLDGLVAAIQRSRRRELARLEREPRRLRGRPHPIAGWDPDVGRVRDQLASRASSPGENSVPGPVLVD